MKCTWVVQTNLNEKFTEQMITACAEVGDNFLGFKLRPFSTRMPMLKVEEPFVLLGSTTLNLLAAKSSKYKKGVFYNPRTFKPSVYAKHYKELFLNADGEVTTLRTLDSCSLLRHGYNKDIFFVRSNDDSKQVSGGTCTYANLLRMSENALQDETHYEGGDLFSADSEIFIARPKDIDTEWRLVFMNGGLVAGSMYRPHIDKHVPKEVKDFATNAAEIFSPHSVFVMDVCLSADKLYVLECNCFNGCGFYDSDLVEIIRVIGSKQKIRAFCMTLSIDGNIRV